jgi:hypothetical protein
MEFPSKQVLLCQSRRGNPFYAYLADERWHSFYSARINGDEVTAVSQDYMIRYPTMPKSTATWLGRLHGIISAETILPTPRMLDELSKQLPKWSEDLTVATNRKIRSIKKDLFHHLVELLIVHDDMLQIVYMLLKKDGSVPKVDYQYVYT